MKRHYEEVLPVGYIVVENIRYMLLHPEPLQARDAWANGLLYFSVVKSGEYLDHTDRGGMPVFTYSRLTLMIHPNNLVMEIGYTGKPILVWTGEYEIGGDVITAVPDEALAYLDQIMFGTDEGEDNE